MNFFGRTVRHIVTMSAKIPELPEIEKLSPNVIRILGNNPSKFTLQGASSDNLLSLVSIKTLTVLLT